MHATSTGPKNPELVSGFTGMEWFTDNHTEDMKSSINSQPFLLLDMLCY